jgi:hypothetical protein
MTIVVSVQKTKNTSSHYGNQIFLSSPLVFLLTQAKSVSAEIGMGASWHNRLWDWRMCNRINSRTVVAMTTLKHSDRVMDYVCLTNLMKLW